LKILQITYSLGAGGAERFITDLSNELSRQGNEVTLCVLRDDQAGNFGFYKNELGKNIKYINLRIPAGFRLKNIRILYALIRNQKPEIVHCHLNLVNYILPLVFFFQNVKFFHTIHSDARREVSNKLEYWLRSIFYRTKKMKAITISSGTTSSFIQYYKVKPYVEITNGRSWPKPTSAFDEIKESWQKLKDEGNKIFLHIATCSSVKNQKMLITVFNKLIYSGEKVHLFVIGSGFDSELGQELKKLACNKIFFIGEKHNVFDYLLNADAFCLTSFYEGMPMSLIEALSCGCTPICTPVGGIVNTITEGITGYLSNTVNESDYYDSVIKFLNSQNQVKRDDLVKLYVSKFSIEECANQHLKVYAGKLMA